MQHLGLHLPHCHNQAVHFDYLPQMIMAVVGFASAPFHTNDFWRPVEHAIIAAVAPKDITLKEMKKKKKNNHEFYRVITYESVHFNNFMFIIIYYLDVHNISI